LQRKPSTKEKKNLHLKPFMIVQGFGQSLEKLFVYP